MVSRAALHTSTLACMPLSPLLPASLCHFLPPLLALPLRAVRGGQGHGGAVDQVKPDHSDPTHHTASYTCFIHIIYLENIAFKLIYDIGCGSAPGFLHCLPLVTAYEYFILSNDMEKSGTIVWFMSSHSPRSDDCLFIMDLN